MPDASPPRPFPTVDERASRLAQGLTALLTAVPVLSGRWALLALPIAHLASSLFLGQKGNLGLRLFKAFLAPRLGPPVLEDARPPRFANLVGLIFLAGSAVAQALGLPVLGWALAGVVLALATLAATTGFCLGCRIYVLYRHVQPHLRHRDDPRHAA
jgi:hypothetical protein